MKICAYCHEPSDEDICRGCGSNQFMQDWQLNSLNPRDSKPKKKSPPLIVKILIITLLTPIILTLGLIVGPYAIANWLIEDVFIQYDDPWSSILIVSVGIALIAIYVLMAIYLPQVFDKCFWGELADC